MPPAEKPPEEPDFKAFDERLRRARGEPEPSQQTPAEDDSPPVSLGQGLQAGIELLAGVGGGVFIGWWLDRWLGTSPWLMIVLFVLGAAAGMLNASRAMRRMMRKADN